MPPCGLMESAVALFLLASLQDRSGAFGQPVQHEPISGEITAVDGQDSPYRK
jgi:hypothetical protein